MNKKNDMDTLEAIKQLTKLKDTLSTDDQMAIELGIRALQKEIEIFVYDQEEMHENCTVQILTNSKTGQLSIGWWEN